MRMKRLLALSVALVTACKPPTPAEQMESIQSWLGTAVMVGDAWLRHTAPDTYSRQTLDLSHETLLQISEELLKSPPSGTDNATLDNALSRSNSRVIQLARLIEAKDAPGFTRQLDSLRADQKLVKRFADSIESKQ